MVKVLYITEVDPSGKSGHNIASKEVISALTRLKNVRLYLLTSKIKGYMPEYITYNIYNINEISEKKYGSILWNILMQFTMAYKLINILLKDKPDIIVKRMGNCITVPIICKVFNKPYYLLIRGIGSRVFKENKNLFINNNLWWSILLKINIYYSKNVYVAYKEIIDDIYYHMGDKINNHNIELFPNAVNPRIFIDIDKTSAREKIFCGKYLNDYFIGFIGSMKKRHMLKDLVDAIYMLKDTNIKLLIIGEGPYLSELKQYCEELNISNIVIFVGYVLHDYIGEYISSCDCMYGVIDQDNVENPIKCYEYLCCGKPVITSDKNQMKFIEKYGFGIVLENVNSQNIKDAINRLRKLNNSELNNIRKNARNYIVKNHTWDILVDKIIEDFNSG